MTTPTFSKFFALLALACWVAVAAVAVLAVARRRAPGGRVDLAYRDLRRNALWLAWIVALVATLGSLYYSEVAHFTPCALCWFQRIAMYPLSAILLIAAIRRDHRIWMYVLPQAVIGAGFAIYHTQLQAFPDQTSSFCSTFEPCTTRFVWQFGFVSLPFMALSAFAFIITMLLVARSTDADAGDAAPGGHDDRDALDDLDDLPLEGSLTP